MKVEQGANATYTRTGTLLDLLSQTGDCARVYARATRICAAVAGRRRYDVTRTGTGTELVA